MNRIRKIESKIERRGERSLSVWESRYYSAFCEESYYGHLADMLAVRDLGID
ncbi:MAG: hypothetical protein ABIG28_01085 [archaeon]